jgi:hypothetical protein
MLYGFFRPLCSPCRIVELILGMGAVDSFMQRVDTFAQGY